MPSWETPISASREIVGAITEAADSAVDAATNAVRSARRRRSRRAISASWRWIAAGVVVLGVAALIRRRRAGSAPAHGTGHDGVGRTARERTDGRVLEYDDDLLADATRARATAAD